MSLIYTVKKNYDKLPTGLLKCAGALYYHFPLEKRYGNDFRKTLDLLKETEYLSRDEIDTLVNERFLYIVKYAVSHVPYYRRKYAEYGVNVEAIRDISDIVKLPTIDKEELRTHRDEFISDEYKPNDLMYITTSGSTGNPVGFYQKKSMVMTEWAYVMHIWSRVGCKPDSSRLVLRGKKIRKERGNPYIFYDPLRRELNCDVFNMTEENLENYCIAIEKYKPEFIHGYMSAIMMLAKYIETRSGGLKHRFKGVLAVSENILQEQRDYVEKILGVRVFSFYGHSERLVIAGECEKSSLYHIEPLYGYCELLDSDGIPANEGEIVGTGFLNDAMPLIRYHTRDHAVFDKNTRCECGRMHLKWGKMKGREKEFIVAKDGVCFPLTAIDGIHIEDLDNVIRYRFIQNEPGKIIMYIMPAQTYESQNGEKIKAMLENRVNRKISIDIKLVDNLPVGANGKYKIVEQKLPVSLDKKWCRGEYIG